MSTQSGTLPIYDYEVDGMENSVTDFDDANVPSLSSISLLERAAFERKISKNMRDRP
jgi:meiotically up-regulated gene 157 (Mug157) protein